jgi:hypothetical protein
LCPIISFLLCQSLCPWYGLAVQLLAPAFPDLAADSLRSSD